MKHLDLKSTPKKNKNSYLFLNFKKINKVLLLSFVHTKSSKSEFIEKLEKILEKLKKENKIKIESISKSIEIEYLQDGFVKGKALIKFYEFEDGSIGTNIKKTKGNSLGFYPILNEYLNSFY